ENAPPLKTKTGAETGAQGAAWANGREPSSLEQTEARTRFALVTNEEADVIRPLVDRAKEGDADAFGVLYDRFQPEILRYLLVRVRDRDVAEDLVQQVFLKAWQAVPRYQHRGAPFRAWLY